MLHKTSQTISIATLIIFFSGCLDKPSTIEETPFQQSSALMRAAVSAVIINNDYASLKNGALDILNAELEGAGRDHTFFKKWKNATANYYIFLQEGELPTSTPFFVGIDFTKGISQKRARYFSNQYADYPQGGAYFLEKDSFEETVRRWLLKASLERITLIELHLNNGQIVSSSNKSFEDIQSLMNAILVEPFGAPSTK